MEPFDRRLLALVPGARPHLAALTVLGVLSGVTAIAQALAVAGLVLAVVQGEALHSAGLRVVLAFVARGLVVAVGELVAARAGTVVSGGLRRRLADHAMAQGLHRDDEDQHETVTLLTQGVGSVEPYVSRYLPSLVSAAVVPFGVVLAMVFLDPWTALVPVLTIPLLPLFAALIGMATRDATEQRWQALEQLSHHFLDIMRGLPTLVSHSRAHLQSGTIRTVSDAHRRATVETLRIAFLSSAALELLATLSVAIVAVLTGIRLAEGGMSLAVGLPLILLAPEAYWPIRRVGAEFHSAADGATALGTIATILAGPVDVPEEGRRNEDRAIVHQVFFRHAPTSSDVLTGLSFTAERGLTVLVGPSGSGKTTTLELLAGLRVPTSGQVLAPRAHLVTQRPFLAPASLRTNLTLSSPRPVSDRELGEVLDRVALGDLLASLPRGLDTTLGEDGFGLSAGQRARVALARALLSDAPLLLLDEPTANLDAGTEAVIDDVVRQAAREHIVVAASHRPSLVAAADAVVGVGDGAALARGR
ncbi:thiol reductant ABC exporter subunit CydD [Luteococcus sediminum]